MGTQTILTLIGFVVVLIGYIAVHRLAESRNKRDAIRPAVLQFKSTFTTDNPIGFYKRYKSAVRTVEPVLPKRNRRKLQKAWDQYCNKEYCGVEERIGPCEVEQIIEAVSSLKDDDPIGKEYRKRLKNLHTCLDDLL